jgi:hypothetical protein
MPQFIFEDAYYRALGDLLLGIRNARAAFAAAKGKVEEWQSFTDEIMRGQRGCAPLPVLIDECASWAARWWRRSKARTHRPGEPQNSRNSQRPLLQ